MTLPNFIILGAARCGTTAMTRFLQSHPDVSVPYKEPNYFSGWGYRKTFSGPRYSTPISSPTELTSLEHYQALFAQSGGFSARGEASISYLIDTTTAKHIAKTLPSVKLIVLLRQPAERAYSHFLHARHHGVEPLSDFMASIDDNNVRRSMNWYPTLSYVYGSRYPDQLTRYFARFSKDQIRIYLHEDWNKSPLAVWQDLVEFLNIGTHFIPDFNQRINFSRNNSLAVTQQKVLRQIIRGWIPSEVRKHFRKWKRRPAPPAVKLDAGLRDEITNQYFRDDILRLEDMIDRDLSHWQS